MKKFLPIFIILSFILFTRVGHISFADDAVPLPTNQNSSEVKTVYKLLAPIGIKGNCIDTSGQNPNCASGGIGDYFNIIVQLVIAICGVLAVVMIVVGGIQYMGEESVFGKTEARSKITSAVLGLLIAIGSYAILNTINPALLGKDGVFISQVKAVIVDLPDVGDGSVDPDFKTGKGSYSSNLPTSAGVISAVQKLQNGWEINSFTIHTNNTMVISLKKGGSLDNSSVITIDHGVGGFAEVGQGKTSDKKTPKGSWKILSVKTSPNKGAPVYSKNGSNMGASFWLLSPTTNGERGIGMHGNKAGTLTGTYGCIRLKNSDILALLPYVKTGTPVIIEN